MAVAVQQSTLTPNILANWKDNQIPEDIWEEYVQPLIKDLSKYGISDPSKVEFDPERHIIFTDDYYAKTDKITLEQLKINNPHQDPISPIGITEPFPLFSDEAIDIMRWEMFQKKCFLNGRFADHTGGSKDSGDLDIYLRGHTPKHAPFIQTAWTHPKVTEIVSKMSQVELDHLFQYEIGSSNVCIKRPTLEQKKAKDITSVEVSDAKEEDLNNMAAILSWHFDSPQFSCVLMMSDTERMIGGETALVNGDGELVKVVNPKKGWANMIQGRIIKHVAPKPKGDYTERITTVGSYKAADPMKERCVMTTIKPSKLAGTRYNDFYNDYMNYRLNNLVERVKVLQGKLNTNHSKGEYFDQIETINFIQNQIVEYAEHTWQEFECVDDGFVEKPASYKVIQARWE